MRRSVTYMLVLITAMVSSACRDEAVGIGDLDGGTTPTDATTPTPDTGVDERCESWAPSPGELRIWNSTSDVGERHAAAAVGHGGTALAVWATDDGVWGRARCSNGAPLREGGLDTRLDDSSARSLAGPDLVALPDGGFVVTWRDDTDASIRATWLDATGQPVGPVIQVSTATATALATGRPPRVVLLTDGDLIFVWNDWRRRFDAAGSPGDQAPQMLEYGQTLDVAAGPDGTLLQLRDNNTPQSPADSIDLHLTSWGFTPGGAPMFVRDQQMWPILWHPGRRGFVIVGSLNTGRAALSWPGNHPYDVWLAHVRNDGLRSGDPEALGDGGDNSHDEGWLDVAMDGLGETRVAWRKAEDGGEIHTWSEADEDQLLLPDWGHRPHYPRLAASPGGGFLLLMTPDESHPEEDVLFMVMDP